MRKLLTALLCAALFSNIVVAETLTAGAQKAKDLVKSGISYYRANGADASWKAFDDVKGKFRDGEFYLFVFDFSKEASAVCVARGDGNMALVGKDMWTTKDPDGNLYIQAFVKAAKTVGAGWIDYKRTNPTTKKIEAKSSYVERIPNTDLVVGCGFYKD